ncbi:hypothetical protein G9A89_006763 [Geosiphon pyriformis]|nr:hypothetical protein G9A89_006763 [Geosiphon pyriformis]
MLHNLLTIKVALLCPFIVKLLLIFPLLTRASPIAEEYAEETQNLLSQSNGFMNSESNLILHDMNLDELSSFEKSEKDIVDSDEIEASITLPEVSQEQQNLNENQNLFDEVAKKFDSLNLIPAEGGLTDELREESGSNIDEIVSYSTEEPISGPSFVNIKNAKTKKGMLDHARDFIFDVLHHRQVLSKKDKNISDLQLYAKVANVPYCQPYNRISISYFGAEQTRQSNVNVIVVTFGAHKTSLHDWKRDNVVMKTLYPAYVTEKEFHRKNFFDWKNEMVHGEMYRDWCPHQRDFLNEMKKLVEKYPNHGIRFVGHGLGGAYAIFAMLAFIINYPKSREVAAYTFGQPRIGNRAFARFVNEMIFLKTIKVYRATILGDPIILWPDTSNMSETSQITPFQHHETEFFIDEENQVVRCQSENDEGTENKSCSAGHNQQNTVDKNTGPYFSIPMGTCIEPHYLVTFAYSSPLLTNNNYDNQRRQIMNLNFDSEFQDPLLASSSETEFNENSQQLETIDSLTSQSELSNNQIKPQEFSSNLLGTEQGESIDMQVPDLFATADINNNPASGLQTSIDQDVFDNGGSNPTKVSFEFGKWTEEHVKDVNFVSGSDAVEDNLALYARMANTAYCFKEKVSARYFVNENFNFRSLVTVFSGLESDLHEYQSTTKIDITTYPENNLLKELEFRSNVWSDGSKNPHVHTEIYRNWLNYQPEFLNQMKIMVSDNKYAVFRFAGHGLGGAYAIFATLTFMANYPNNDVNTYTYGEPRIGNREFAKFVNTLITKKMLYVYRATKINDPVVLWPNIPLSSRGDILPNPPFSHHSTEYFQDENNRVMKCNRGEQVLENKNCAAGRRSAFNDHNGKYFGVKMGECVEFNIADSNPILFGSELTFENEKKMPYQMSAGSDISPSRKDYIPFAKPTIKSSNSILGNIIISPDLERQSEDENTLNPNIDIAQSQFNEASGILGRTHLAPNLDNTFQEINLYAENNKIQEFDIESELLENIKESMNLRRRISSENSLIADFRKYARFAKFAYCISENSAAYLVSKKAEKNSIIVTFHGLEQDLKDYMSKNITNFESYHVYDDIKFHDKFSYSWQEQKVHMKIYATWRGIQDQFLTQIKEIINLYPDYPINLTGHSLAFAIFASLALVENFSNHLQVTVYTYGQPRLGNDAFAAYVNTLMTRRKIEIFRITRADDPVVQWPQLPKATEKGAKIFQFNRNENDNSIFRHHGNEYWLTESETVYECWMSNGGDENPNCANGQIPGPFYKHQLQYFEIRIDQCENFKKLELNQ